MASKDDLHRNAVLRQLPPEEFDPIAKAATVMDIDVRHPVYESDQPITDVYFPISAVFSIVALSEGRVVVEVATTGREGMLGLPVFLGRPSSPHAAFCQVPGRAARLRADDLRTALARDGALHDLLGRCTQAILVQIGQNVLCNAAHPAEKRACRWLLTTQDRAGRDVFPITQEFLGQMLGVRRPTVSEIAGGLQARGLIRYSRGVMTVIDRAGLEAASCDCYEVVRRAFDEVARPA